MDHFLPPSSVKHPTAVFAVLGHYVFESDDVRTSCSCHGNESHESGLHVSWVTLQALAK